MAYENVVSKQRSPQPSELSRQTGKGCGLLLRQTGAQRHCCCQRSTEGSVLTSQDIVIEATCVNRTGGFLLLLNKPKSGILYSAASG